MKNLILINGTMGVGKTATGRELQKILPHNVFLDGDWCWDMRPFVVTEETKKMVLNNITYLLNGFLTCNEYENIVFCWVMHEQAILDKILSRLNLTDCSVKIFSLIADRQALQKRLREDVADGKRSIDVMQRSLKRMDVYHNLHTEKIDVSCISAAQAAALIQERL